MERYQKQTILPGFGIKGQELLKSTTVLVIGAGGLGVPIIQQLTAFGVGKIGIMDGDIISISNLPRQLLYTEKTVGQKKVEVAAQRLRQMNSEVNIIEYPFYLNALNALDIFPQYDFIVDATDRFDARYLINDVCVMLDKVWIYGAVFQWEGQWGVWNFSNNQDIKTTYRDLFPRPPKTSSTFDCNEQGVFATVPQITGFFMANELIKVLLYPHEIIPNTLFYYHFLKNKPHTLKIIPSPLNNGGPVTKEAIINFDYGFYCGYHQSVEIKDKIFHLITSDILIVDVRQLDELPKLPMPCLQIPLQDLGDSIDVLRGKKIYFICQSGLRSRKAYVLCRELLPESQMDYFGNSIEHFIKTYPHV